MGSLDLKSMATYMSVKLVLGMTRSNCRGTLNHLAAAWMLPKGKFTGKGQSISSTQTSKFYGTYEGTDRQPYPLTKDETFAFLEDCLDIEHTMEYYQRDPEGLLNKIVERMGEKVPFSTGHLFTQTMDDANDLIGKYHILRGHGGSCSTVNPFTNAVLQNIGYKTRQINGFPPGSDYDTHITTLVCDATFPGSRHFIDPGTKFPFLKAVPLDFDEESPVYKFHYMNHKFFKRDGLLIWCFKAQEDVLKSLEDFKTVTDANSWKWQILTSCRLEQEEARVSFNKVWHEMAIGEREVPPGVATFVFNAFLEGNVINILCNPKELVLRTFKEDGLMEKVNMTEDELKSYFTNNFGTFSQHLLKKVIAADYCYTPRNVKSSKLH